MGSYLGFALCAVEETLPEFLFELQNLLAERGLRDMALLRSARKIPRSGHRDGIAKLVHFHRTKLW